GRVVLITKGASSGKLAVIVEIIDQKRVLIDGPVSGVPRQAIALAHTTLTPLTVSKLTRGSRSPTVAKRFKADDIAKKWAATSWAKNIAKKERRVQLTDFERFQVLIYKKQRNFASKKALARA
ncbi:60S ribosomal protein eL14, partial [Ascoidea rubescens DSM 1968]